jgi:hypothetical protein
MKKSRRIESASELEQTKIQMAHAVCRWMGKTSLVILHEGYSESNHLVGC